MDKYTYFKDENNRYTIKHRNSEEETYWQQTFIATTDTAEKADFLCKAANTFAIEKYENDLKHGN